MFHLSTPLSLPIPLPPPRLSPASLPPPFRLPPASLPAPPLSFRPPPPTELRLYSFLPSTPFSLAYVSASTRARARLRDRSYATHHDLLLVLQQPCLVVLAARCCTARHSYFPSTPLSLHFTHSASPLPPLSLWSASCSYSCSSGLAWWSWLLVAAPHVTPHTSHRLLCLSASPIPLPPCPLSAYVSASCSYSCSSGLAWWSHLLIPTAQHSSHFPINSSLYLFPSLHPSQPTSLQAAATRAPAGSPGGPTFSFPPHSTPHISPSTPPSISSPPSTPLSLRLCKLQLLVLQRARLVVVAAHQFRDSLCLCRGGLRGLCVPALCPQLIPRALLNVRAAGLPGGPGCSSVSPFP
ncbi:unnamed protein product [Closterium sp. Naga37s-1]|nr:unnamed protein product [Closterium sp. Naga37s-1]